MFRPITSLTICSAFFTQPSTLAGVSSGLLDNNAIFIGRSYFSIHCNDVGNKMKRACSGNPYGSFSVDNSKKIKQDNDVRNYITQHGFGEPIPPLNRKLSADVFRQHYYDKNELMDFCRQFYIPTSGLKEDLNKRIELFLRTGQVMVVTPVVKSSRADSETGLTLNKIVVNYKSDPRTRDFLASNITGFTGFSALVQKQIRQRLANRETFTYGDVVEMQKTFMRDKANARETGQPTKVAHDSCQLNQFSIDYSHDPAPKLHSMNDAWMLVRNSAGDKTYQRYKDKIEEIKGILSSEAQPATPTLG